MEQTIDETAEWQTVVLCAPHFFNFLGVDPAVRANECITFYSLPGVRQDDIAHSRANKRASSMSRGRWRRDGQLSAHNIRQNDSSFVGANTGRKTATPVRRIVRA